MKATNLKPKATRNYGNWPLFIFSVGIVILMVILKLLLDFVLKKS
jgi:hypothetical protein